MTNKICSVAQGILEPEQGLTIDLESPQWLEWLETHKSFRYCPVGESAPFTARKEGEYWYGYRKRRGELHKRYIGKALEVTIANLEEIASLLNLPNKPRSKKVEQSVTETNTNDDITQLWQALAELRSEVVALRKSPLTVAPDIETTGQQGDHESISEELQKTSNQIQELDEKIKILKDDNQKLHKQLQIANSELQKRVTNSSSEEILRTEISQLKEDVAFFRELSDGLTRQKVEWYESLQENPALKTQVTQLTEEVSQLRSHSERLLLENSELQNQVSNSLAPDYEATRDRALAKLKMGRQSPAGKAIQAFIRELRHVETSSKAGTSPSVTTEPIQGVKN